MSLNWSVSEVENHDELFIEVTDEFGLIGKRIDSLTEAFIWRSMSTGLGPNWRLDEKFAPEFYARIKLLEKLDGPLVFGGPYGENYRVTFEDVQRRIGLTVNVSPVSRSQFLKNAVAVDLDAAARLYVQRMVEFVST